MLSRPCSATGPAFRFVWLLYCLSAGLFASLLVAPSVGDAQVTLSVVVCRRFACINRCRVARVVRPP
jgi:hypothetical protein